MSSVTNPPTMLPPGPPAAPSRALATLEQLRAMDVEPDERVVIRGVDWDFYEQLVDSIPEDEYIRVDYDGTDMEIVMVISYRHDGVKKRLGQFIEAVAQESEIPYRSGGQTTWKRPEVRRGLEADDCYFFRAEKLAMIAAAMTQESGKWSEDVANYPNPDLATEIDISRPEIDRPDIYATLQVAEVWRFDDETVYIDRLGEDGRYQQVPESRFLPVTAEEIRRWVVEEDASNESAWARRLRAWVRAEVAPRLPHRG
jgi:Putative restriction endonuclease